MSSEYDWHAKLISKNRITVPDMIVKEWGLNEGDKIHVTVSRPVRYTKDVIING